MRRCIITVLIISTISVLFSFDTFAATTSAAGTVTTQSGRLNVRNSPDGKIISSLAKGTNVMLHGINDGWYKVEYAPQSYGYCSEDFIKQISSSEFRSVKTTYGRLYVRSTPAGQIKDALESGTRVAVISEAGGWSKIVYNGTNSGYVSSSYLIKENQEKKYRAISLDVPDFKQNDSRWANHKIGNTSYTIGSIGCTTTALAMTESFRTGKTIYPNKMEEMLSYSSGGSLYWPSNYYSVTDFSAYLSLIYSKLEQGKPVIVGAKKANGSQHWVTVTGVKATDTLKPTDFLINDPGTATRTNLGHFFGTYHYLHKIVWYTN